ncbi:S1C family serine protease [Tenacibaculum finnmarkense genomovar ulcerans]|uniref:trypsin-like peptidase domain-containing protein n=1 Tax=Tenacibaculum finnmarkense TaxID=2781243 RepID=UPI001E581981|nr:S1C family serine protease [Tenacibaculum finnmarkense]MCD8433541.1 S1C family serine protease [Tenacibaculum finnmarkense genomovar ulcerans]
MKKQIFLFLILIIPKFIMAQDYLTSDTFSRVFNIKYKMQSGTTFLISKDSTNYFVTAKHILQHAKYGEKVTIEIYQDSLWKTLTGKVYFDKTNDIDVALVKPENFGFVKSGISLKDIQTIIGDEGYFLGFPYGLKTNDNGNINSGFPFPLVKKAMFSGTNTNNGVQTLFLDGHNNPGFSGGPVLFKDRFKKGDDKYHLIGIISAYVTQQNELITPFGKLKYIENSGIIVAIGKKQIDKIIEEIKTP